MAVAAIGMLAVTGCSKDASPATPTTLVIGDSLTVGAEIGGLGDDGLLVIDAEEGRTTEEGIAIIEDLDLAAYDDVIVALGTNDYTDTEAEFAPKIERMVAAVGKPVTWVNVDTGTAKLAPAATGVNAALEAAGRTNRFLTVADWDAYINGRDDADDLRAGDGVHDSSEGYRVRAEWMAELTGD